MLLPMDVFEKSAAEIDSIAISINMMPLVDPTFTGFFADALDAGYTQSDLNENVYARPPPCIPSLDEQGQRVVCKLTRVLHGFPTVQPPCDEQFNYIMDHITTRTEV